MGCCLPPPPNHPPCPHRSFFAQVEEVLSIPVSQPLARRGGGAPLQRWGPAARGAFDFLHRPFVEYWRRAGFAYSEAQAHRVVQVVVRHDAAFRLNYPADKVFRITAAAPTALGGCSGGVGGGGTSVGAVGGGDKPAGGASCAPAGGGGRGASFDYPWTDGPTVAIRDAIVAPEGFILLGADYSQVDSPRGESEWCPLISIVFVCGTAMWYISCRCCC